MSDALIDILKLLVAGGILSTIMTYFFHRLSELRQFRLTLNQKMIDRISHLVEQYYQQISSSSESLRTALRILLAEISNNVPENDTSFKIGFYRLLFYLHHVDNLKRERPKPLFTEVQAEREYVQYISEIYKKIPFDDYEISFLLTRFRIGGIPMPLYEFVGFIDEDEILKRYFEQFISWLKLCECVDNNSSEDCPIHQTIRMCFRLRDILDVQMQKMYEPWYESNKKRR